MSYSYRSVRTNAHSNNRRPRSYHSRAPQKQNIDPRRFVATATAAEATPFEPIHVFKDFDLLPLLQRNVVEKGYTIPSPVQDQAIPLGLKGHDVIGLAGTGTGKTAAFALPVLQRLLTDKQSAALIVAPTRELAQQIEEEMRSLAKQSGLNGTLLIGGTGMGKQLQELKSHPRIVIGTPGRIKDHINRRSLRLHLFNMVVLDEVDRMLDMGFIDDVRFILEQTNPNRQSFFFSATMAKRVEQLVQTFSKSPITVSVETNRASDNVHQDVVEFRGNMDRIEKLHELLLQETVTKVIVFDETQRGVERLYGELAARGFKAGSIHGGKNQGQRQRALAQFKQNQINILVATDVAARGIDVADVSHVINYSIPKVYDDYIHRIGRAGRAGQIGYAFTFVSQ
jgi:ATP-dependent RNA helicase RhlE